MANYNIKPRWKKGQSGNPKGRPKGKTLKEFARELLLKKTDEEKIDYLRSLPQDLVWRMAEGNPKTEQDVDITSKGLKITFDSAFKDTLNEATQSPETSENEKDE